MKAIALSAGIVVIAALGAIHALALDGIQGFILPVLVGDETIYAPGYSYWRFRQVKPGISMAEVRRRLGPPLGSTWTYESGGEWCYVGVSTDGRVEHVSTGPDERVSMPQPQLGDSEADLLACCGRPSAIVWHYTSRRGDGSRRIRRVVFDQGHVVDVDAYFHAD